MMINPQTVGGVGGERGEGSATRASLPSARCRVSYD